MAQYTGEIRNSVSMVRQLLMTYPCICLKRSFLSLFTICWLPFFFLFLMVSGKAKKTDGNLAIWDLRGYDWGFFHEPLSLNVLIQLPHLCKNNLSILHCSFANEIDVIALLLAGLNPVYDHMFVWVSQSYETKSIVSSNSTVYSWSVFSHLSISLFCHCWGLYEIITNDLMTWSNFFFSSTFQSSYFNILFRITVFL